MKGVIDVEETAENFAFFQVARNFLQGFGFAGKGRKAGDDDQEDAVKIMIANAERRHTKQW